jgi:hypothetical protein
LAPRINSYILEQESIARRLLLANAIQRVPPELQPKQIHRYPEDNTLEFERWFKETTTAHELAGKPRTYLPILWTGYWCNNGYGRKDRARKVLQRFVDSLPRNKAYFSIVQYDDGPMVDFKDLDIKIFGMSGGRIDYPIPLLCQPHKYEFPGIKKDIFCSFVGADTHPIRRELVKEFEGKPDCYVTLKKHKMEDYCRILARSVFALCPRGYGKSSFRIMEAIQYGAIPIYIATTGEAILPYCADFSKYGTLVSEMDIPKLPDHISGALKSTFWVLEKQNEIEKIKHLYTYEGCKKKILENI